MNIEAGGNYFVKVIKLEPFGAIVELEDKSTRLIHISNIADAYIADIGDYLSVGRSYPAQCKYDETYGLQLTLTNLDLRSAHSEVKRDMRSRKRKYK